MVADDSSKDGKVQEDEASETTRRRSPQGNSPTNNTIFTQSHKGKRQNNLGKESLHRGVGTTTNKVAQYGLTSDTENTKTTRKSKTTRLAIGTDRKYIIRYDMKLHLEPSMDALTTLKETIKQILEKLKEANTSLLVVPYKECAQHNTIIAGPNGIPRFLSKICKYFPGTTPKTKDGLIYARVI
mmetsp:Transcript_32957/g.50414  ORF Transcript_32957/g.50414 Transcript_32957/m.50414 type:complete len:184 (+) Transcript_32957:665-1216(+)